MKLRILLNQASDLDKLDARILLQHATKLAPEVIYLELEREVDSKVADLYLELINRRRNHEPVAKIIGSKAFWLNDFIVNNHTLDPRPDSEVIINQALKILTNKDESYRFLDLGTGTGCLLLSLLQEFKNATGVAVDISAQALEVTQLNVELLKMQDRVTLLQQNWGDSLTEKFDLIVSNPPYIPRDDITYLEKDVKLYDPILALDGGIDGLDPYRYLAKQIFLLLKPQAYAILEFGYGQSESIKQIFLQEGYKVEMILLDLAGIQRAIVIRV